MSSERPFASTAKLIAATAVAVMAGLLVLASATPAAAGTKPNRLDDNRGDFLIQTTVNSFVSLPPLLPFFFPFPFLPPPPVGPLSPRVLENPEIFNVYWDDNWNDHHSGAFSTDGIDDMTKKLVQSNYFNFAGQYDVGGASFDGSNTSGGLLNPCSDTPGAVTNFLAILGFIECETNVFFPTGVHVPGGNTLYVIYVPRGTTIDNFGINQSCDSFGAYHFMGTTLGGTIVTPLGAQVAFAVIPIDCADGSADKLSTLASHEIIEAATDPNVVMGWIDNSKFDLTNLTPLFTEGEAADICEPGVGDEATDPVRLDEGILVATYWSNKDDACVPFPTADLAVTKTDSPDPVNAGEQLYYTVTVTNHGPNDVPDAIVKDTLPSQVDFVTDDRGICSEGPAGTLTCNFGKILNGATSTVVIKVRVKADTVSNSGHATGITNSVEVASDKVKDPDTTNNTATASTIVDELSDAKITKECKPDQPNKQPAGVETFCEIYVDNLGPSVARNVVISDRIIAGPAPVTITGITSASTSGPPATCPATPIGPTSGTTIICNDTLLPAGARDTIRVTFVAGDTTDVDDTATVTSDTPDPNTSNNTAVGRVSFVANADLSLTKTGPATAVAGTNFAYSFTVANAGPSPAANVVLKDTLPAGISIVTVTPGPGNTCTPGVPGDAAQPLTCNLGSIASGASEVVGLTVKVLANTPKNTNLLNNANVSSSTSDPNTGNNNGSASTIVDTLADLSITKTSDADQYKPNTTITYHVTATNNGPSDAQNVKIVDTLPEIKQAVYVSDTGGCVFQAPKTLTCGLGTLAAGASKDFYVYVSVKGAQGDVTNVATVSSSTSDLIPANNTATRTVSVKGGNKP